MTAVSLTETWKTTTFRLVLLYGGVFAAGVVAVLTLIYLQTYQYIEQQTDQILAGELQNYRATPVELLPSMVSRDVARDVRQVSMLGLFAPDGRPVAGNVRVFPARLLVNGTFQNLNLQLSSLHNEQVATRALAVRLPDGSTLLLGRRQMKLDEIRHIIFETLEGAAFILLVGTLLGVALSWRPVKRIRAMQAVSQQIIQGDIQARLPVEGRDDEIDMLARMVNRMLDEIAQRMQDIKGVSDNIAHNLSTPLTHLRAMLNRLLHAEHSAQGREAIEQALFEADTLMARFRAILRIAEISGSLRRAMFEAVDLKQTLLNLSDMFLPPAEEAGLTLCLKMAENVPLIHGDAALLFEALLNVVDNAVKYTPSGGTVTLVLRVQSGAPVVEVMNDGPGICAQDLSRVTQPFFRGEAARSNAGGHGVGLSIVQAIVNLHGFKLHIESRPGATTVAITCSMQLGNTRPDEGASPPMS